MRWQGHQEGQCIYGTSHTTPLCPHSLSSTMILVAWPAQASSQDRLSGLCTGKSHSQWKVLHYLQAKEKINWKGRVVLYHAGKGKYCFSVSQLKKKLVFSSTAFLGNWSLCNNFKVCGYSFCVERRYRFENWSKPVREVCLFQSKDCMMHPDDFL